MVLLPSSISQTLIIPRLEPENMLDYSQLMATAETSDWTLLLTLLLKDLIRRMLPATNFRLPWAEIRKIEHCYGCPQSQSINAFPIWIHCSSMNPIYDQIARNLSWLPAKENPLILLLFVLSLQFLLRIFWICK